MNTNEGTKRTNWWEPLILLTTVDGAAVVALSTDKRNGIY
jgi:hypothetical protein